MSILVQQFELSDVAAFQPLSSSITKRNWELRKACKATIRKCMKIQMKKLMEKRFKKMASSRRTGKRLASSHQISFQNSNCKC